MSGTSPVGMGVRLTERALLELARDGERDVVAFLAIALVNHECRDYHALILALLAKGWTLEEIVRCVGLVSMHLTTTYAQTHIDTEGIVDSFRAAGVVVPQFRVGHRLIDITLRFRRCHDYLRLAHRRTVSDRLFDLDEQVASPEDREVIRKLLGGCDRLFFEQTCGRHSAHLIHQFPQRLSAMLEQDLRLRREARDRAIAERRTPEETARHAAFVAAELEAIRATDAADRRVVVRREQEQLLRERASRNAAVVVQAAVVAQPEPLIATVSPQPVVKKATGRLITAARLREYEMLRLVFTVLVEEFVYPSRDRMSTVLLQYVLPLIWTGENPSGRFSDLRALTDRLGVLRPHVYMWRIPELQAVPAVQRRGRAPLHTAASLSREEIREALQSISPEVMRRAFHDVHLSLTKFPVSK